MGLFDKTYNAFMSSIKSDPTKDAGTYDKGDGDYKNTKNANSSANPKEVEDDTSSNEFLNFRKKYEGMMIVKRMFLVEFSKANDNKYYVSNNFMKDDIRKITKIRRTSMLNMLNDYTFTMKRLNPVPGRNDNVMTVEVKDFDTLEKMFNAFEHPQYKMYEDDSTAILELVSNERPYHFGAYKDVDFFNCNPADFISVWSSKYLGDLKTVEEKLIDVIARKFGMSVEKLRATYGNEIFRRNWKFRDKNQKLSDIVMSNKN